MSKLDYHSVRELELKAAGIATADKLYIYRRLEKGEIFGAFDSDYRQILWMRYQKLNGLIPTLRTFFDDFNYLQSCAVCMKKLIHVPYKGTLWTAMKQNFDGGNLKDNACAIQSSESVINHVPWDPKFRIEIHYRQLFLFIMRHLHKLSPESILMEYRKEDKRRRITKDADKATFQRLAILADQLGFVTPQIEALKSDSQPPLSSASKLLDQSMALCVPDEPIERRAGRPFRVAHKQSKGFLFFDNMQNSDHGSKVTPFVVRRSVYQAFFDVKIA